MNKELEPELLIVGNTIHKVRRTIEESASFDDLVAQVRVERGDNLTMTPPLPAADGACRIYAERGKYRGMLIQNNPCVRKINYHDITDDRQPEKTFEVSLPWVWVMCVFQETNKNKFEWINCYLCATYQNIVQNDLSEPVFRVPLPNQWGAGQGKMCTGSAFRGMDTSMALTAGRWITCLWDSTFNGDLEPSVPSSLSSAWRAPRGDVHRTVRIMSMLRKWEEMTKENKVCSLSREFGLQEYGCNIGGFIQHAFSGRDHL